MLHRHCCGHLACRHEVIQGKKNMMQPECMAIHDMCDDLPSAGPLT